MKPNRSMITVVLVMALVSFMCLSFSVSYSYVMRSKTSGNTIAITTDSLNNTTLNCTTSYTSATSIERMGDTTGLESGKASTITISKNNNYSMYYSLNVSYAIAALNSAGFATADLIPEEYIRVALYNGSTKVMGPVALGDLPIYNTGSNSEKIYHLAYGTFATGNKSATYTLKMWLDRDIPETYDGKVVYLQANSTCETSVTRSTQNISGTVKNSSGTVLSGATVSIQHGQKTATTNSSGVYSITGVPVGLYNVTVTYGGVDYTATMKLTAGTAVSVAKNSTSYSTATNSYNVVGFDKDGSALALNLQLSGTSLTITKG